MFYSLKVAEEFGSLTLPGVLLTFLMESGNIIDILMLPRVFFTVLLYWSIFESLKVQGVFWTSLPETWKIIGCP